MSTPRRSRKRRRVDASVEAENVSVDQVQFADADADEQDEEKNDGEEDEANEKERAAWEAFREEFVECVEQLPLSLHRNFALLKELDRQAKLYHSRLLPAVRQYIDLRFALARRRQLSNAPESAKPVGEGVPQSVEPKVEHEINGNEAIPPTPAPDDDTHTRTSTVPSARAVSVSTSHREFERESSSATLPSSYDRGSKILPYISHLMYEYLRAAEEKVNLAQAAYDSVDRHIRLLDQAIRDSETGLPGSIPLPGVSHNALAPASSLPLGASILVDASDSRRSRSSKKSHKKKTRSSFPGSQNVANGVSVESGVDGAGIDNGEDGGASVLPANGAVLSTDMPIDPHEPRYCFCNAYSYGEMIRCDNEECQHQWFHYGCVGLKTAPRKDWYCEDCIVILGIGTSSRKKGH